MGFFSACNLYFHSIPWSQYEQRIASMPTDSNLNRHTQVIIPLSVKPQKNNVPTITGHLFSKEAGTVLYGHSSMEYLMPGGDRLRIVAKHNEKTVQLILCTHSAELIQLMPGERLSSLVANTITELNRYRIRANNYIKPLSLAQQAKLERANRGIGALIILLEQERQLDVTDYYGQEQLRIKVINLIEACRDENRLISTDPTISEGSLGTILYEAQKSARHYQFNRVYKVSPQDQMDFSRVEAADPNKSPCFVWDSEIHIGHNSDDLDNALRTICHFYHLIPAHDLNNIPANRLARVSAFMRRLWQDGTDWLNHLAEQTIPEHKSNTLIAHGLTIHSISTYYQFKGLKQKAYVDLQQMMIELTNTDIKPQQATKISLAKQLLATRSNNHWVNITNKNLIVYRRDDKLIKLNYFVHDNKFYPLPQGQDLYTISQISKRHLYWLERFKINGRAFVSKIPEFFKTFYHASKQFIIELHNEFDAHVHKGHPKKYIPETPSFTAKKRQSIHHILKKEGVLANGQTLEEFIKEQIKTNPYIIARANHPPSPPAYQNPVHRMVRVLRHLGGFFIDTGEKNPIIGTLAMAAYVYGAGAVVAPDALKALLHKLHLNGLISGIEPTQRLARLMSHGTTSEALSAAVTYWQGTVAGGNLDEFFIGAINLLKDDPAEIAIISTLALSLGYGLTRLIPILQHEIGDLPYPNYAALGGKGGAALYDTIVNPGDDWLLGTCKWFLKGVNSLSKLIIAPFVESYHYGINGLFSGLRKSGRLILLYSKKIIAASMDLVLMMLTIPLIELSALLIHIPFRGISNLCRKALATLGNISSIGQQLLHFSLRPTTYNFIAGFKRSPLYGFSSPLGSFSSNQWLNMLLNGLRILFIPPLQLIKNLLILPLLDLVSLTIRVLLTLINPTTRILAHALGTLLNKAGYYWDNSIGLLFSYSAIGLTLLCDWLDNRACDIKHALLMPIELSRRTLYHWAFNDDDIVLHNNLNDVEYYLSNPERCDLIPHAEAHSLYGHLLARNKSVSREDACNNSPNELEHFNQFFTDAMNEKCEMSHASMPQIT